MSSVSLHTGGPCGGNLKSREETQGAKEVNLHLLKAAAVGCGPFSGALVPGEKCVQVTWETILFHFVARII